MPIDGILHYGPRKKETKRGGDKSERAKAKAGRKANNRRKRRG